MADHVSLAIALFVAIITLTVFAPYAVATGLQPTPGQSQRPQVAAGCTSSYALRPDGTIRAWGANTNGQLGDGTTTGSAVPVTVATAAATPLTNVRSIAAGCENGYAVRADGTVWAWGRNDMGQLAAGNVAGPQACAVVCSAYAVQVRTSNVPAYLDDVTSLAAGADGHVLALRSTGTVFAWGRNANGQLGTGSATGPDTCGATACSWFAVPSLDGTTPLTRIRAIAATSDASFALVADGTTRSWGSNAAGRTGLGTTAGNTLTPATVKDNTGGNPPLTRIVELAAGADYVLGRKSDGTVVAWGDNAAGQLGIGTLATTQSSFALPVVTTAGGNTAVTGAKALAAGATSAMLLKSDGTPWAWGSNTWGQLGRNDQVASTVPVQVRDSTTPTDLQLVSGIAMGTAHGMAVKANGTVWTWGLDQNSQLGYAAPPPGCTGGQPCRMYAQQSQFAVGTGYTAVIAGSAFTIAIAADGKVWTWGSNYAGKLGINTAHGGVSHPVVVDNGGTPFSDVIAVGAGKDHGVLLKADGSVWAWGEGGAGNLGDGDTNDEFRPSRVEIAAGPVYLNGITNLSANEGTTLAVADNGEVWGWGENEYGQLGNGNTTDGLRAGRTQAFGGGNLSRIMTVSNSGGFGDNTVAVRDDGSAWAWGENGQGQVGQGNTSNLDGCGAACSTYARQVRATATTFLTDVTFGGVGDNTSLVGTVDGAMLGFGWNIHGEIGMGTTNDRQLFPTATVASADSTQLLAKAMMAGSGNRHSLVARSDGKAWAWGSNYGGQVGDGTAVSPRTYGVTVSDAAGTGQLSNVIAVDGGAFHSVALDAAGVAWAWGANKFGEVGDCSSNTTRSLPVQVVASCGANRAPNMPRWPTQYDNAGVVITRDGITPDGVTNNVRFGFEISDPDPGQTVTGYVEVRPVGTPFSSTCGGAGTYATTATGALTLGSSNWKSTTVTGLTNGLAYNWRACTIDSMGLAGPWWEYNDSWGTEVSFRISVATPGATEAGGKQVATGCATTYELKADGTVWAVGDGAYGQLGNGWTAGATVTPTQVRLAPAGAAALTNVVDIAAGCEHAVAVTANGDVYSWGRNDVSQLAATSSGTCGTTSCGPYALRSDAATLTNMKSVTAGDQFSVALKSDGTALAWGDNTFGQLGRNTVGGSSASPVVVKDTAGTGTLTKVKAISAGTGFAAALRADGTVWAWGSNSNHRLGFNGTLGNNYPTPQQVLTAASTPLVGVKAIDAGSAHGSALGANGSITAWGRNDKGQLGINSTTDSAYALAVRDGTNVTQTGFVSVSGGGEHTAARKSDGTIWTWGRNDKGQLGVNDYIGGACGADCHSTPQQIRDGAGVVVVNTVHLFKSVSAGNTYTAVLKANGTLWAWGQNASSQLGATVGTTCPSTEACAPSLVASNFTTGNGFVDVAAGGWFGVAVRADGTVWTWGNNNSGTFGNGFSGGKSFRLQQVKTATGTPLTGIVAVQASRTVGRALGADGTVWGWGEGWSGKVGNNAFGQQVFAKRARSGAGVADAGPLLTGIVAVEGGDDVGVALRDDGVVVAWGDGDNGALGDGACCADRAYAQPVKTGAADNLDDVTAIGADGSDADQQFAVRSNGTVWGWGHNDYGQLAIGTATGPDTCAANDCSRYAVQARQGAGLANMVDVIDVNSSDDAGYAALADGTVLSWGSNRSGELGNNSYADTYYGVPVRSSAGSANAGTILSNVISVSGGDRVGLAVTASGTTAGWGWCTLGDGSCSSRIYAVNGRTSSGVDHTNVIDIDGGMDFSNSLRADGSVWSTGVNDSLQLADCTENSTNYFVKMVDPCGGNEPPQLKWFEQYRNDRARIPSGSWTPDGITNNIYLEFTVSDPDDDQVATPYIEFAPVGTPFSALCGDSAHPNVRTGAPLTLDPGDGDPTSFTITGLTAGTMYHWRACAKDAGGAVSRWTIFNWNEDYEASFGVDNITPSNPSTVFDGDFVGVGKVTTDSKTTLSANWTRAPDNGGSGSVRYRYCLTTSVTGADCAGAAVRAWTDAGTDTAVTVTGLSLTHGTTYYTCVWTTDGAANAPVGHTCSNGQLVQFDVASVSPASAPQGRQGLVLQINGSGFRSDDVVTFGASADIAITATNYVSPTRIDVTVNISSAGTPSARSVSVTHAAPDGSVATRAAAFSVTAPSITLAVSTLGYNDGARDVTPGALSFGTIMPGTPRDIGPAGSGQTTAGAAVDLDVTSDTDWRVQLASTAWVAGANNFAASALAWKHNGVAEAWTPATTATTNIDGPFAPNNPAGGNKLYDLRLTVPGTQTPGTYSATMTYTIIPAA